MAARPPVAATSCWMPTSPDVADREGVRQRGRDLLEPREPLLVDRPLQLELDPLRHVHGDADQPDGVAVRVLHDAPPALDPPHGAVRADRPVLDLMHAASVERAVDPAHGALPVVGVQPLEVGLVGAGERAGLEAVDGPRWRRPTRPARSRCPSSTCPCRSPRGPAACAGAAPPDRVRDPCRSRRRGYGLTLWTATGAAGLGPRRSRRSSCALAATTIVDTLISTAPTAGASVTPAKANTPAATGIAMAL